MTNEERDLITRFVSRVAGTPQAGAGAPPAQPLPPVDRDADAYIGQMFQQYPDARYRITQTAVVTEAALAEAQNRIQRLQWELEQAQHAMQTAPQQTPQSKGFFSSLFGGGAAQQAPRPGGPWAQQGAPQQGYAGPAFQPSSPPPQPQYPPNYQPGMFQSGGSGFLGGALKTAAGVAGGLVVGNALMNAFSGPHTGSGLFGNTGGFGGMGGDTTVGNPFGGSGFLPTSDPTGGFNTGSSPDPFAGGGQADTGGGDPFAGGGAQKDFDTQANYDQGSAGNFDTGGGFDTGGSGGFDNS